MRSKFQETIEVYVGEDGDICIAHVDMSEDSCLSIPPEQVDAFVRLLKERKAEAVKFRKTAAAPAR